MGMCVAMPAAFFQIVLYRQNLVMAHEKFPAAPTFTGRDRLLVLSPHCDDETLGVDEADITFLGYPDGGTKTMWETNWTPDNLYRSPATGANKTPYANSRTTDAPYCGEQALRDVREVIEEFQPTAIFTTHPSDTHPDHWAAYAYANTALQELRLQPGTQDWAKRVQLLTFLVHRGPWPAPHGYHPDEALSPPAALKDVGPRWVQMPLDEHARAAKKAALECYVSQLAFTPQYLRGFLRRNELLGFVPVTTLTGQLPTTTDSVPMAPVVRDPSRDSLLHDVWPSADLKSLTLVKSEEDNSVRLRVRLSQAPSARLTYRFSLHSVATDSSTGAGSTESMASTVVVTRGDCGWRALLRRADSTDKVASVPVQRTADGFEIELSRAGVTDEHLRTLLVSGSTHLGSTSLDQTELGTVRLIAPAPATPKLTTVAASVNRSPLSAHRQ
jgi:LmbE family N-acetylglucosaminyl deacetylase